MAQIINEFKSIEIDSFNTTSDIQIIPGHRFRKWTDLLDLFHPWELQPIAKISCGSCGSKYAEKLDYNPPYLLAKENHELSCACGHKDYISYHDKSTTKDDKFLRPLFF